MRQMLKIKQKMLPVFLIVFALSAQVCAAETETEEMESEVSKVVSEENADAVQIELTEDHAEIKGDGAKAEGTTITIAKAGAYRLSGSMDDAMILVDAGRQDEVVLELAGVSLTNESDPAIYVKKAGYTTLLLAEGTENRITSGTDTGSPASEGKTEEDEKGGAIYAKDDLGISGSGSLEVSGYINNGIHCSDTLTIADGTIAVDAVNHGIRGNDAIHVTGGSITASSGKDALHSEAVISVSGGSLTLTAGDDGMHADRELTVSGGSIDVLASYEGIEANQILLSGGEIRVAADDDGINANGGDGFFNPGSSKSTVTESPLLRITGGSVYVNAQGDGLDSNADLLVEGGTVIVDGPEMSANGAIDSGMENGGVCSVNGGTVLAIGAAGMAESFGSSSGQVSFQQSFSESYDAGSSITITDGDGEVLMEHSSAKRFSSIVFSCPALEVGETVSITVDGETIELTLDSVSTGFSSGWGMMGQERDQMGGGPGMGRDPQDMLDQIPDDMLDQLPDDIRERIQQWSEGESEGEPEQMPDRGDMPQGPGAEQDPREGPSV